MFYLYMIYLQQFWWILLHNIVACFWPFCVLTLFGQVLIQNRFLEISLVVFPTRFLILFLYYYLSYLCLTLHYLNVYQLADYYLFSCLTNQAVVYSYRGNITKIVLLCIQQNLMVSEYIIVSPACACSFESLSSESHKRLPKDTQRYIVDTERCGKILEAVEAFSKYVPSAFFLLVVYLVGNLISITLLSIILILDMSIISYHIFIPS